MTALDRVPAREAGPELDAEIAEKVMGYFWLPWRDGFDRDDGCYRRDGKWLCDGIWAPHGPPGPYHGPIPQFSTEVSAAWSVVEKMQAERGFYTCIQWSQLPKRHQHRGWRAEFGIYGEDASTAPLAICLAALRALSSLSSTPESA